MKHTVTNKTERYPGTLLTYTLGFAASLVLTFAAYLTVTEEWITAKGLTLTIIMALAVVQLIVQLVFFLHLGRETRPRWNYTAFWFMVIMISIIVGGSIWIMNNLNYNMMMTPEEMNHYMMKENEKGF